MSNLNKIFDSLESEREQNQYKNFQDENFTTTFSKGSQTIYINVNNGLEASKHIKIIDYVNGMIAQLSGCLFNYTVIRIDGLCDRVCYTIKLS